MKQNTKTFIQLGSLVMALGVALGAFGAHGLKNILDDYGLAIYKTAVEYQFYHGLGILFIAFLTHLIDSKKLNIAGYMMFVSILIFSGSLYALSITQIKILGAITPIGGLGFILSWILVIFSLKEIKSLNL